MCGRFTRKYSWKDLHDLLDLQYPAPSEMKPSWNVAPSHTTPVCRLNPDARREIAIMQWGFLPRWAKDSRKASVCARSETAATNGMFRDAYRSRRCLVPISGFYEWQRTASPRQPYYFHLLNDDTFCLAGLWEPPAAASPDAAENPAPTFAILTTAPNELMATIHDRMPVIIRREDYDTWLAGDAPPAQLLEPFPAEEMDAIPVSTRVNNVRNDDPALCAPSHPPPGLFDAPR